MNQYKHFFFFWLYCFTYLSSLIVTLFVEIMTSYAELYHPGFFLIVQMINVKLVVVYFWFTI